MSLLLDSILCCSAIFLAVCIMSLMVLSLFRQGYWHLIGSRKRFSVTSDTSDVLHRSMEGLAMWLAAILLMSLLRLIGHAICKIPHEMGKDEL